MCTYYIRVYAWVCLQQGIFVHEFKCAFSLHLLFWAISFIRYIFLCFIALLPLQPNVNTYGMKNLIKWSIQSQMKFAAAQHALLNYISVHFTPENGSFFLSTCIHALHILSLYFLCGSFSKALPIYKYSLQWVTYKFFK